MFAARALLNPNDSFALQPRGGGKLNDNQTISYITIV
jgi:hypothetical protein